VRLVIAPRTVFCAAECPIDLGPMYLLRDARTEEWLFYATCCGLAMRRRPNGLGDDDGYLSGEETRVLRARLPTREEIAAGPWSHLTISEEPLRSVDFDELL
jgi:hypothetical protein